MNLLPITHRHSLAKKNAPTQQVGGSIKKVGKLSYCMGTMLIVRSALFNVQM
jgi:hypothetical protein